MDLQPEEDAREIRTGLKKQDLSTVDLGCDSTEPRWHLGIHLFIVIVLLIGFYI